MEVSKKVLFIRDWILNYTKSMPKKAQSLVIGISGGIDSSVTSTLCAMTGLKTIVVSMPINQIISQHDLSLKHKKWLKDKFDNVESRTVELDEVFKSFQKILSDFNSEHDHTIFEYLDRRKIFLFLMYWAVTYLLQKLVNF